MVALLMCLRRRRPGAPDDTGTHRGDVRWIAVHIVVHIAVDITVENFVDRDCVFQGVEAPELPGPE